MSPWSPSDLNGKSPEWVAHELFGEDLTTAALWTLARTDEDLFELLDDRFAGPWQVSHGFLVALHEVSTRAQANAFAQNNRITLLEDGGWFRHGTAEICIRATVHRPEEISSVNDLYRIRTRTGIEAFVGYASLMFARLISGPASEDDSALPDAATITTLVLRGVDKSEIQSAAEQVLFHLRGSFVGAKFLPGRIPDLVEALEAPLELPIPRLVDAVAETTRPEAVAFFNRAEESEPVLGFLYFYRVIESCFDDVLSSEIAAWRADRTLNELALLKNVRGLTQKEDVWSLRRVLGVLVDQTMLDRAAGDGLIPAGTADALGTEIYLRRNSIAHGRRGQHDRVLIPFCVSGQDGRQDLLWRDLMKELAGRAMKQWILKT